MAHKLQTIRSGATQHPEMMLNFLTVKLVEKSGCVDILSDNLLVKAKAVPELKVEVVQGGAFLRTSDGRMVYPVDLSVENADVVIGANASGNPRKDAIVLYQDLAESPNADATNVSKLVAVQGAPAASPVAPSDAAISAAIGASNPFIRLANVTVATGDTSIEEADIEDTREIFGLAMVANQDFIMGDVKATTRSGLLDGWLLLDGKTIGNTNSTADYKGIQYKALFDHLQWSVGYIPTDSWANNGKIALPDGRDRAIMGVSATKALGVMAGADNHTHTTGDHTLTEAQMPIHTHTQNSHNHSQNAHGHSDAGHNHLLPVKYDDQDGSGSNGITSGGSNVWANTGYANIQATTATNNAATATNNNTGGGQAHNHGATGSSSHIPKYLALNYYIKY